MLLNSPTKEKIVWTNHSKEKMKYYRLSDKRVLNIFRKPQRKEEGVAFGTVASMQPSGTKKHPTEIWMMYQTVKVKSHLSTAFGARKSTYKKIKIISAWRYPGITPVGNRPIIPEDTLSELDNLIEK